MFEFDIFHQFKNQQENNEYKILSEYIIEDVNLSIVQMKNNI